MTNTTHFSFAYPIAGCRGAGDYPSRHSVKGGLHPGQVDSLLQDYYKVITKKTGYPEIFELVDSNLGIKLCDIITI